MAIKLTLNSQQVLNKTFEAVPRGYNPLEVDQYLDRVIRDYRIIEENCLVEKKEIDKLTEQIKKLESEKKVFEIENAKYEKRFEDIQNNKNVTVDNIDLMKRIAALEKFIYKLGYNPKTIK